MVEDRSVNTNQNMQFSAQVIQQDGGSKQSKKIFVTNNYHTLRAGILAHKQKNGRLWVRRPDTILLLTQCYYSRILSPFRYAQMVSYCDVWPHVCSISCFRHRDAHHPRALIKTNSI
ncbi:ElyC/SanA/YdcF family protein [Lentilactobacillus kisonensis]|uniref:ElyC/SanA/YdcF family protein n=1 Tax=Lentilactobacillus kisonensis TaxID=481722 RepID=UPI0034E23EC7